VRYDLFDYQREAAVNVLKRLDAARDLCADHGVRSTFALSAVTGSGKTVIAAAVIEAVVHGSADLAAEPDPRAAFLWVTDDPALNRQTRKRMIEASDLLHPNQLIVVDNDFLERDLRAGRVYFLNVQKLSKNSGLAQGGNNLREISMWEVIANTVNGGDVDLYLVLDEAHKGMKVERDRSTIVQRIINGQAGSNPPVPVVWGISATIERFDAAMKGTSDRNVLPAVTVDLAKVRASGLVKDQILLDEPAEKGTFGSTLLREAIASALDYETRWAAYAETETEPAVLPILVVQVPDKSSETKLAELAGVIESQWPGLGPDAVVNVFGEHKDLDVGDRRIRWVNPEAIQDDVEIRVVLAKEAISTGWDCPRAEVLYSERPATDSTHIAQVIGRMVRQPLARRVPTDDVLNSVACYLPLFNRKSLAKIKEELERPGEGVPPEVVVRSRLFPRNEKIPADAFELVEALPSVPTPDPLASPLRRAKMLAKLLTDDAVPGGPLMVEAGSNLTKLLNSKLDGLAAQYADQVAQHVENIESAEINRTTLTHTGQELGTTARSIATHAQDLDRDTRRVIRSVREGVGADYLAYRRRKDSEADPRDVRVEVAALLMINEVLAELDKVATTWVQDQLTRFAVEIKNTTGATRDAYMKAQEQTSRLERVGIELPLNEVAPAEDADGTPYSTFERHLYADSSGMFPAKLNDWESVVVNTEVGRKSTVAWYRNPARAARSALRIAYQDESGSWKSLQVDFVVISRRDEGTLAASIVDPHGDHLADAKFKLRALADYAESYGDEFVRIESVAKAGDALRVLDLKEPQVRAAVRAFEGGKVTALYKSDSARDYA
jgi:type III restriction enzyme